MSAVLETTGQATTSRPVKLVDCDVHIRMASEKAIAEYLPEGWRRHHLTFGGNSYHGRQYPRTVPNAARVDAWPTNGGLPGSDLDLLRKQLLDRWNVDYAIVSPLKSGLRNLDYAAQVSTVLNDWTASEWLDKESRLRASIVVPFEDPKATVAEIERIAADDRFVQVYMQVRTAEPLGRRKYWPIYEAAEHYGLPIGVHFGGSGGNPSTGAGWPSYYLEDHGGNAQAFQAQVTSLVMEGVFESFPRLKYALIEGGVAWLPPLAWRMDQMWMRFRGEVPHVSQPPSSYIAEHFWLTTQPIEEPPNPRYFLDLIDAFPALVHRLMFSTDYPHWDFDSPDQALRHVRLPDGVEERVRAGNACLLYGL